MWHRLQCDSSVFAISIVVLTLCVDCDDDQPAYLPPTEIDADVERGMKADAYERQLDIPVEAYDDE